MTVTLFYLSRLHNIRKYSFDAELFGDIRYSVLFGIRHYSFEVFVGIRYSVVFGIRLRIPNNLVFDYPTPNQYSPGHPLRGGRITGRVPKDIP